MFDLGCNIGDYAVLALEAGARNVVGFDFDQRVLDGAFARAASRGASLPAAVSRCRQPQPGPGLATGRSGAGFAKRAPADALLALAFEHHLAIGRNVPLAQLLPWLTGLAHAGVIEFVPKSDPTVQRMLALAGGHLHGLRSGNVQELPGRECPDRAGEVVSAHGRRLFWYDRH